MEIVICGSISHYNEMAEVKNRLEELGHIVLIPDSAERLFKGEVSLGSLDKNKLNSSDDARKLKKNFILKHMEKIKNADAVLIVNMEKKGIDNYIGGNTFLEMGFAFAFEKKIFLYNPIPQLPYEDEISGMLPIVIERDLIKIK